MKRARIHDRYRSIFCVRRYRRKTLAKRMLETTKLDAHLMWMDVVGNSMPPHPSQWYGGEIPESSREDWLPPETPPHLQRTNTSIGRMKI